MNELYEWNRHEENLKELRRLLSKVGFEKCPFCGTNCQSDCQHSRPWRGEVGEHKEIIG